MTSTTPSHPPLGLQSAVLMHKKSIPPTEELNLRDSRQSLKPVDSGSDMSPRRRQLLKSAGTDNGSGSGNSFGSRLNKRLSLKKNTERLFNKSKNNGSKRNSLIQSKEGSRNSVISKTDTTKLTHAKTRSISAPLSTPSGPSTHSSNTNLVKLSDKTSGSTPNSRQTSQHSQPALKEPTKHHKSQQKQAKEESCVKKILFQHQRAKITSFENIHSNNTSNNSSSNGSSSSSSRDRNDFELNIDFNSTDRIIGHGDLVLYRMQTVHYLHCGTVIYPILPKLKILRIAKDQFILPLSNPERYWLISLSKSSGVVDSLDELGRWFAKICSYRNLYIASDEDKADLEDVKSAETPMQSPTVDRIASSTSISSDLACFDLYKMDSHQSSLDLELDEFEETLTKNFYSSVNQRSRATSVMSHSRPPLRQVSTTEFSIHQKPSFETLFSKNASVYQTELSWMNVDEEDSMVLMNQRLLTNNILFQNIYKSRNELVEIPTKAISQQEVLGLIRSDEKTEHKSMMTKLFGW